METQKDRLLTVWPETGGIIGASRAKSYSMVADGTLPCVRYGRCVRVPYRALLAWIEANTTGGQKAA